VQSKLRLRIDGHEIGPAHEDRAQIRQGKTPGYNHWGSVLIFSLPPGVSNGPETAITLWHKVKPRLWVTLTLLASTFGLGVVVFSPALRAWAPHAHRALVRWGPLLYPLPAIAMIGLCLLGLLGAFAFFASSLYAWMNSWALPTTAPIRWFSWAEWAAR